jgi:hypothetical protein
LVPYLPLLIRVFRCGEKNPKWWRRRGLLSLKKRALGLV